jgi:hypothetical protein
LGRRKKQKLVDITKKYGEKKEKKEQGSSWRKKRANPNPNSIGVL